MGKNAGFAGYSVVGTSCNLAYIMIRQSGFETTIYGGFERELSHPKGLISVTFILRYRER